jgi:hypothetical protein
MPREDRRIIFDMSETYQAIYKLSFKQEGVKRISVGAIVKIEEDGIDPNKLNFFIENPQDGTKTMETYTRDFVAAALMMFCRGLGIPLPKKASKAVVIDKNSLILRVIV